jgi:hypothetical protein
MTGLGLDISGSPSDELERELNLIYQLYFAPRRGITISYSTFGGKEGNALRPSVIVNRLSSLFEKEIVPADTAKLKTYAKKAGL